MPSSGVPHGAPVHIQSLQTKRPATATTPDQSHVNGGATPHEEPASVPLRGAAQVVLLTQDDTLHDVVCTTFSALGLSVTSTPNAEAWAHIVLRHLPYLLIVDLDLLGADGRRLIGLVRTLPTERRIQVIVISKESQQHYLQAALECGADDFLLKPLRPSDLALRAGLWLKRASAAQSGVTTGLHIVTLGRFRVEHAGKVCLAEGARARKVAILFKFLLTNWERTVTAVEVQQLLWPDTAETVAASDLRSLLYQVRRQLGLRGADGARVEHGGTTLNLRLHPNDWWDVTEFTALLREADTWRRAGDAERCLQLLHTATALYGGDYLEEDVHADWAELTRRHLRIRWLNAQAEMAVIYGERGELEQQECLLRAVMQYDPYREPTYRALMELLAQQGRGAEALVLYRQLETLLKREFDGQPARDTQVLAARIAGRTI